MRTIWLAAALPGCRKEDEPVEPAVEPCGDAVCDLGENQGSCPADCPSVLDSQMPRAYTSAGDGQYVTGSGGTRTVGFLLGDDFAIGQEDEPVPHDLFDWSNYLIGADPSVDLFTGEVSIAYDATGPLAELLGFGADPPNPLVLDATEALGLGEPIGRLTLVSDIHVIETEMDTTIDYALATEARRVNLILSDDAIDFGLVGTSSLNPRGVSLNTTAWGGARGRRRVHLRRRDRADSGPELRAMIARQRRAGSRQETLAARQPTSADPCSPRS